MTDCCPEMSLGSDLRFQHEGDYVEVYGGCLNCGATVKDVFTFAHTEVVAEVDE